MKIQPLDERVLVEPIEEEKKQGLIVIPDVAKKKSLIGRIVAVGTDEELNGLLSVGDRILFTEYAGDEIEIEDKKHLVISRDSIIAKVL